MKYYMKNFLVKFPAYNQCSRNVSCFTFIHPYSVVITFLNAYILHEAVNIRRDSACFFI